MMGLPARRFPPPWTVEELDACFVVTDSAGQKLCGEFPINSDALLNFFIRGCAGSLYYVLMAANAVRFRCP